MFIFACCVLPIFFVTRVGDWGAVLLIGIAGAAHQAWSANLFTTASDMFPKRAVASVVGHRRDGGLAGRDHLSRSSPASCSTVPGRRQLTAGTPSFSVSAARPTWSRSRSTTCWRRGLSRSS